ncbi:hypothetical protein SOVF_051310 isoform A [Spinacia oleracea]|uniref:Uncharacterized protein isoform X3 n=1 Tax=Spinacia oleracea TaxID=3562 RepID=A0A9R0JKV9_SPIOL|nr:uncharacterized protein LOC110778130 isoform X3 [Spinacia oleracea]KNA20552.1 hypothetical protein SOVF_051310 isoform A [Spinacia oleracea]
MEAVELAIPVDVAAPKLMGSDVFVGARVCSSTDGEARDSETISPFLGSKIDECTSLLGHRGTTTASGPPPWLKKTDAALCRNNFLPSRSATEDASLGVVDGITSGSTMSMSEYEGKQIQRKVGKFPRNGSGLLKKTRMLQSDNFLSHGEADEAKTESDKLGLHLMKCSNAVDKSQTVKQKTNINGRRGDRRNSKAPLKAKFDPFSLKVGLTNFSPASGANNLFGIYGLKPDTHDVSKLMDDISLDELLDGTYKCPNLGKEKGKKAASLTENILDSVKKAFSVIRLPGMQQAKQPEEVDIQVNKKIPLSSSPSNTSVVNGTDVDESSVTAGLSKCGEDLESSVKAESPADKKDSPLYQPRDILERLALPPPKELDSLLQDAMKPVSSKLNDSRNGKPLSHRASLPPFPWSHNFNGHHKSNNDSVRISSRSTCQGRWVRIRSTDSFIGGGDENFVDLDSLTYDNKLVPAGQLIYQLPEIGSSSSTFVNQQRFQQNSSSAACQTACQPPSALHSPRVLAAAQTLCDIASDSSNRISNGMLKWSKQPSQKSMKARKSRSSEKPEEFLTPKSETLLDHAVRSIEYGSTSKKPKISMVERREEFSHIHTVIGLSSVSAPRSNRSSPSRLSRDSVAEARNSFVKPQFMAPPPPPPPRVLDRNNHNPQKLRKVSPMDWNRTRS